MVKPRPLEWGYPTTWGLMRQVISFSFVGMFGAWGGAPGRGFSLFGWAGGAIPHCYHHPKNKTINPTEGVTPKTPTMKTHPKGREGGHILPTLKGEVCHSLYHCIWLRGFM